MTRIRIPLGLAILLFVGMSLRADAAESPGKLSFEHDVRPVLKAYCLDCHGGESKLQGGLDLRLKRFAVTGGDSGPAVKAGDASHSLLIQRMKSGEMPPGEKKVPADKIAVVEAWINAGAPALRDEPAQLPPGIDISPQDRAYWFYQPIQRNEPPKFSTNDKVRTPVDAFVLAKLRERGLTFNPDADSLTLLRRACFDLTGLPPSQQEADQYLADQSDDAYEKLLDRLLASPHYGERWGRHWLDVAGYADSEGNGASDTPRLWSWKYRDYVVRSLNADKGLDQFIIEQLAGDELVPQPWNNLNPAQIETLAATGFLRMVPDGTANGGGPAEANQVVVDNLRIIGSSLLGLTVACAQCHDHRYDPIPQVDYYRLRAIFEPAFDPAKWRRVPQRLVSLYNDNDRAKAKEIDAAADVLQKQLNDQQSIYVKAAFAKALEKYPAEQRSQLQEAFETPVAKRTEAQKKLVAVNPKLNVTAGLLSQFDNKGAEEIKKLQEGINAKKAEKRVEEFIAVTNEVAGPAPVTRVFHRGDYLQPKDEVRPGDLTIAAPDGKRFEITTSAQGTSSGRRLAFAKHLVNGQHPLLGRVLANRIWHHHFGRGIVDTPGDFGMLGVRPTHPELLDWLASEMVRQGWSLKQIHKLVMTSTVYRQSSRRMSAQDKVDAGNTLLGRYPLRRLEAEVVRDRILATCGKLDRTPFGPPMAVKEDMVGQVVAPDDQPRRSIYLQVRRTKPLTFLTAFDAPTASEVNCERRTNSTSAPQSLMLMNSEFMLQQAEHFAKRLQREAGTDPAMRKQVALAWQLAFQRSAAADELDGACEFLERQMVELRAAKHADPNLAALTNLCQQLLSANEFLYVD